MPAALRIVAACLVASLPAVMAGCQRLGLANAPPLQVEALGAPGPTARLQVQQQTAIFRERDGAIDVIVTDLSREALRAVSRGEAGATDTGVILHAHMFFEPHAGRTPIDFTASNTAFSMLVLAGAQAGVYGGGGFILPDRMSLGAFSARTRNATLRLVARSDGFVDQLGSGELQGRVRASEDAELTEAALQFIAGAIQQLPAAEPS